MEPSRCSFNPKVSELFHRDLSSCISVALGTPQTAAITPRGYMLSLIHITAGGARHQVGAGFHAASAGSAQQGTQGRHRHRQYRRCTGRGAANTQHRQFCGL